MRREDNSAPVIEGDVLAGKYRVERVLGQGGMGVVVAARHLQLDQLVALKFVLPSSLEDALVTERFLREAKAAVRLKSEHVAKVLDVGTLETGAPYMVMEYLDGQNLADVIAQSAPLSPDVACDYVIQACEALSEAHSIGIVHRDVKPQNLFLTRGIGGAPLVKVLDFGISKIKQPEGAQNLTQTSTVMGSPLYMAPEQLRSARHVDHRTDIWALGVVLYELLSGKLPFEAETMTELTIRIVQDPVAPIEQMRPDLAPELVAVVYRCLQKKADDRYQDTGELASALEPFAPVASRIVADRTRKVVSALQKTMGMAAGAIPSANASGPVRAVSSPTHRSPGTPEPWTDTAGKGAKSKAGLVGMGIAAAGIVVGLGVLGMRAIGHAPQAVTGDPAVMPSAVASVVPSASATIAPSALAVPQPAPLPSVSPATPATPSATPSASASPADTDPLYAGPRGPVPRGGAVPRAPRPKPPAPPASAKPSQPGDDIPSLR